ncbi:hypothetical protein ASPCADRAFT_129947 [Aspergillus carbonarius ITEM 5010]|uniref:ABM domain-containing protein n=1 Tax=Aspergillus carbonarius (strain ITEM 5010) TaxID=602072 RepID=A0A1R3RR04_ASPC5|nr:hypothetical protein ASPCADRAFT_129947 [Aspergillus carbonarius ITEM 5010]
MTGVHLIATLRPAPGKVAEILCQTARNVEHGEPTCLTFLVTECHQPDGTMEWASQEALEQHQQRAWLRSMYAIFDEKSLLESPEEIETLMFLSGFATR